MTGKTFLLGVGAQKAGTTWLHDWLNTTRGFAPGIRKEYHIWDALTVPEMAHMRVDFRKLWQRGEVVFARSSPLHGKGVAGLLRLILGGARIDPARSNLALAVEEVRHNPQWLRVALQKSPDAYFDHFADLLSQPGIHFAADITPAYSGLPMETLARIRQGIVSRGIDIRVIFLMRDPVDRCFSHARMKAETNAAKGHGITDAQDWLSSNYTDGVMRFRTDYPTVVANLTQVFRPEEVLVGLYETLFSPDGLDRLSRFTGLPIDPAQGSRRVHVGKPAALPDDLARKVAQEYRFVYDWAAAAFPETRPVWKGYDWLD